MFSLCNDWEFTEEWTEAFGNGEGTAQAVRLPHEVRPLPLHDASPADYELVSGYRRTLTVLPEYAGKRLFLQFDGAAQIATVFINGKELFTHRCGYTGFRVEVTDYVHEGENLLAVRVDSRENSAIPPFGLVIDYLTYGGIYREVWLDVCSREYVSDVFVTTPTLKQVKVQVTQVGADRAVRVRILDKAGKIVAETAGKGREFTLSVPNARPWCAETPNLYTCQAELLDEDGRAMGEKHVTFGFRTAEFRTDGFYLNGKKFFLRGLNRHQSYPYIGYAATENLQREDVRILQEELHCTAVRTSHYPQSQYFLDECDRRGMMVFTELPGWQHLGDADWKKQACENLREMILQNRNHPSIILWGVRINESVDDDEFYTETNRIAHELDASRATSGVRYLEKSHLLEDVYAFNDFSHTGQNAAIRPKSKVTTDPKKAFLISECNGHMYPTKPGDSWAHRQEQALRHARLQNAAAASGEHAGCFGWCMFDYPTHKDFGSGDRICYHGVLDSFRNPKLAAALYASQGESEPVLEIGSSMDIGDYPAGQLGTVYLFTNADEVKLYKNDCYVTAFRPKPGRGLKHPPIAVDDTIGELLETQEGFPKKKAVQVAKALREVGQYGLANLPLPAKLKLTKAMLQYHMKMEDGVALYGKYVGNWGGVSIRWRFDAVKNGKVVKSVSCAPSCALHLEAIPSRTTLCEGDTYDMAAVRIRVLNENGMLSPYSMLPITLSVEGCLALCGSALTVAEGGMTGTYLRTTGQKGEAVLRITAPQTAPVTIKFTVQ